MAEEEEFNVQDKSPFPPLQLTYEEQQHCHDLSQQLLEKTLHSYDERLAGITPRHHSNLDSARWKLQKTQENASMYSERVRHIRTDLHLPDDDWQDPTVLMTVGNIPAPLDEVMLGVAVPTFDSFKIRVSTLAAQEIGGAQLARLIGPTENKPFQHLSIFYWVTRLPWLVNILVKPRDFLLLSASGIITTADGERIGYDLLQPAPLPQCPSLPKLIRGKYVMGALYRELEDGSVDVYLQQYLESFGSVFESYIISATWQALLGFFRSPLLAEHKKLEWCMANMSSARRRGRGNDLSGQATSCSLCLATFVRGARSRSDQRSCILCATSVCFNCREEHKYKVLGPHKKRVVTKKKKVDVCRPCAKFVRSHKAADIARHDVQNQLTPASDATGDSNDPSGVTWGLVFDDSIPSWSPRRSLSLSSESFDSFCWNAYP